MRLSLWRSSLNDLLKGFSKNMLVIQIGSGCSWLNKANI